MHHVRFLVLFCKVQGESKDTSKIIWVQNPHILSEISHLATNTLDLTAVLETHP